MKIIAFGDSLTSCGGPGGRYSDILQDRFPEHTLVNAGVGGEAFPEALERLEEDILNKNPDVVLVAFGANDWWRDERSPKEWIADLKTIITEIQAIGAYVIVVGVFGPRLDESGATQPKDVGADSRAEHFHQMEKETAQSMGCGYVANMQEKILHNRVCWRDRNHPNEFGNRFVADTIEIPLSDHLGIEPLPIRKPYLVTLRDQWDEAVKLASGHTAVVAGEVRLTYAEADTKVSAIASGLQKLTGVSRPTVAVHLPNCLEYFLLYWALQKVGGIIVPLNTWLKEEALLGIMDRTDPDLLLVENRDSDAAKLAEGNCRVICIEEMKALEKEEDVPTLVVIAEDDTVIIMHTSGTTSTPKGAVMRNSDLHFNLTAAINAHMFTRDDIHLLINPMFHCTALYSSLPAAAAGKSTVVIENSTSPEVILETVAREGVTTILSIPTVCARLAPYAEKHSIDTSSLRLLGYAGSPMPVETINHLKQVFPEVDLHNFFGLTETISMTHVLRTKASEEHPDSIGRLLPFVRAIVVDEEHKPVQTGEVGELLFAGDNVIPSYFRDPDRLAKTMIELEGEEWFKTGDLARMDEDGFFFLCGRSKDMIIVGGENVFAAEVEGILCRHKAVAEAAVKGVPARGARRAFGEDIYAWVVLKGEEVTEAELRHFCFEHLESYKIPQHIQVIESLPRNPSGKVVKTELVLREDIY
ncbi:MAG: AMP-binding protein [Planctomycetota bacterium]|jgi:acyl-CoA synthetase (AMP-forming)/AMP-acid ligase II/lysophospholipase L1-like esterase